MATIGVPKKVFAIPEPVEAPAFTKRVRVEPEVPAEPDRVLVPVRQQPQKQ